MLGANSGPAGRTHGAPARRTPTGGHSLQTLANCFRMPEVNRQCSSAKVALARVGTLREVPTVRQQRPKRFNYRALPLWLQWGLPFGIATIAVVALVLFVHHQTDDTPSEAPVNTPSAIVEQNKEADALMRQEEAPQFAKLKAGVPPAAGLKGAIAAWLNHQIKLGQYGGPLSRTSSACTPATGSTATRLAFKCPMVAANVTYSFYGVVIPATGKITYCQKVRYPPVYGMPRLKLSKSCLAA